MTAAAYKFLRPDRVAPFSGERWPLAAEDGWIEAAPEGGVHVCRSADLPYWLDAELWAVEVGGNTAPGRHQLVARKARLAHRIDRWNAGAARDYGLAAMRRARDIAVAALRAAGLDGDAERLGAVSEPDAVLEAGHAGARAAGTGHAVAARVAHAAGTAGWHMARPSTELGYTVYAAFSAYAACVCADALDPVHGYDAERARQAVWLAERLELS